MTKASRKIPTLESDVFELLTMLQYKRPSGGKTENEFIKRFVRSLGAKPDTFGNHWLSIGDAPILWSCHTDTVHKTEGKQHVLYGAGLASVEKGECLGADCGTGVWLMAQMIRAHVPGFYIFHADEEIGGAGSARIAENLKERISHCKYAIAFDRKGTGEIITHQASRRCASQAFADSLAACLAPLVYSASDGGTFTDTANYTRIIPECTNISVGYYKQHTEAEYQDVRHARALRDVLITADFSTLVCQRDPAVIEPVIWGKRLSGAWWNDNADKWANDPDGKQPNDSFAGYIARHPHEIAEFIQELGYDKEDVENYLYYNSLNEA